MKGFDSLISRDIIVIGDKSKAPRHSLICEIFVAVDEVELNNFPVGLD